MVKAWLVDYPEYAASELQKLIDKDNREFNHAGYFRRSCNTVIVIGRRSNLTPETNRRRIQLCTENPHLEIITFDRLFDDYDVDKEEDLDGTKDEMRNVGEIL